MCGRRATGRASARATRGAMPPFSILAFGCLALAAHMAPVRLTHWATRSTPLMLRQRPVARRSKVLRKKPVEPSLEKDKHLYFDRVELTVQGGHGGDGAVIRPDQEGLSAQAMERSEVVMPPGGNGGGVLLYVDPSLTDLLHLRARPKLTGERGRDSPGLLTQRELTRLLLEKKDSTDAGDDLESGVPMDLSGSTLRVAVPPGTFVKTAGGKALADLVRPGQEVSVATGGDGGPCIVGAARGRGAKAKNARRGKAKKGEAEEIDEIELSEAEELEIVRGHPAPVAQRIVLLLRTVADVGFVGFPNAGKSTLLNSLTRARATINSYPFTTLMPNLGAMVPSGSSEDGFGDTSAGPVLADLPGLVEGAHAGRGLGRNFLQQLRRVRLVLYVLDTQNTEVDVGDQYAILRRELQLYNPRYLERPHIVALNKLDIFIAREGADGLAEETRRLSKRLAEVARAAASTDAAKTRDAERVKLMPPLAVLPISGKHSKGLKALQDAISNALTRLGEEEPALPS